MRNSTTWCGAFEDVQATLVQSQAHRLSKQHGHTGLEIVLRGRELQDAGL